MCVCEGVRASEVKVVAERPGSAAPGNLVSAGKGQSRYSVLAGYSWVCAVCDAEYKEVEKR